MGNDNDFLDTEALAAMLHTVPGTIRYWRHAGTGPSGFKVGRRVLYRRSAVSAWLAEQETADAAARAAV